MKKFLLAFTAILALTMISCEGQAQREEQQQDSDSVVEVQQPPQEVTGVAIDGAMNSVYLKVGDDTVEFTYPDLDAEMRASWSINDTLTVKYFETESGDSVVQVINGTTA